MMMEIRDFYWEHREAFRIGMACAAVLLVQTVLVLWVVRRIGEIGHMRERLSRLADGLALLTDTTEAGLATLAREVQQQVRKPAAPRAASRATVNKRVVAAARKGEDLSQIADHEALSESEVRLHLRLAESRLRDAGLDARP